MRRKFFSFTLSLAFLACFALGRPVSAQTVYHVGSGQAADGETYFDTLEDLRLATAELVMEADPEMGTDDIYYHLFNGDTIILYGDDNSLTQEFGIDDGAQVTIESNDVAVRRTIEMAPGVDGRFFNMNRASANGSTLNVESIVMANGRDFGYEGGGAVYAWWHNDLNIDNSQFVNNVSNSYAGGGAIYYWDALDSVITDTDFIDNMTSGSGGAMLINASVSLTDSDITNVTLQVTENAALGADGRPTMTIRGNRDRVQFDVDGNVIAGSGTANSIDFTGSTGKTVNFLIDTAEGTLLDMQDPFRTNAATGAGYTVNLDKTGLGTWRLGGSSVIDGSSGTTIQIQEGALELSQGAELRAIGENDQFVVNAGAILTITGGNVLQGTTVTFDDDAIVRFDMDAFFNGNARNDALLDLDGTTLKVDGTLVEISFDEALDDNARRGDYMLIKGTSDFGAEDFTLTVDGQRITNKRFGYVLNQQYGNVTDATTLVLHVDQLRNTVLTWNNAAGNNVWSIEDNNFQDNYVNRGENDSFIRNDSVIFDLEGTHTVILEKEMYISKDNNHGTSNRGMHVVGTGNWTFTGGPISDSYSETADVLDDGGQVGPSFLGGILFSGSGTLTLDNAAPNTYHNGTALTGGGTLVAKSADMLGSTEHIGKAAGAVIVQGSGYGIEFSGMGGTILFQNGTTIDLETGLPSDGLLMQRIGVAGNARGEITIAGAAGRSLVVTADADYQTYAPNKNGGAVNIGTGGTFAASGNILFTNNASAQGGAIYADDNATVDLTGTEFVRNASNVASGDGGAIYGTDYVTINTNGTKFSQNGTWVAEGTTSLPTRGRFGGAIRVGNSGTLDLKDTVFSENAVNASGSQGGAIYANNAATITLTDSEFEANSAAESGGAIFAADNAIVQGTAEFTGNTARTGAGGAMAIGNNAVVNLLGGEFEQNRAGAEGGAVAVGDNAQQFYATDTVFTKNVAGTSGGAIATGNAALLSLTNAEFVENEAQSGGAVATGTWATIISSASIYNRNIATENGGAILVAADSYVNLNGSTFAANVAGKSGGALHSAGTAGQVNVLQMAGAAFQGNVAQDGNGGAIFAEYTDFAGTAPVSFRNNSASGHGGAIYAGAGTNLANFDLTGTYFTGNTAGLDGGALYVMEAVNFIAAHNAKFLGNTAQNGGAVAATGGLLYVNDTTFESNIASQDGGAIRLGMAGGTSTIVGYNTKFIGNQARSGGAIYAIDTDFILSNVQFRDNEAGGDADSKGGAILMETTGGNHFMDFYAETGVVAGFAGNRVGGSTANEKSSSIHFAGSGPTVGEVAVNFIVDNNGVFELLDAMSIDEAANNVQLTIEKMGQGMLTLGDVHDLRNSANGSTLTVTGGTLAMRNGAQLLLQHVQGDDAFSMAADTWLDVAGGNEIIATGLVMSDNFGFDLSGMAPNGDEVALRLIGDVNTVSGNPLGSGKINITEYVEQAGRYNLIHADGEQFADGGILYYKDVQVENNDRLTKFWDLQVDAENSILQIDIRPWENTDMAWTGAVDNKWNVDARNWEGVSEGMQVDQFIDGDSVTFGDAGAGIIDVSLSNVVVEAMTIDSGEDYLFQGGEVSGNLLQKLGAGSLTMNNRFKFGRFDIHGGTVTGGLQSGWAFTGDMDFKSGTLLRPTEPFRIDGNLAMRNGSRLQLELGNTGSQTGLVMTSGTVDFAGGGGVVRIDIANNGVNGGQYASDAIMVLAEGGLTLDGETIADGVYGTNRRQIQIVAGEQALILQSDRSLALQAVVIGAESTELSLIAIGTGFDANGPTSGDFNSNQMSIYEALENATYETVANDFFVELSKLGSVEAKADALDAMLTTVNSASMLVAERSIHRASSTVFDRLRVLNETRYQNRPHRRTGTELGQVRSPNGRLNLSPWLSQLGDFQNQKDSGSARGFQADSYGYMVGVDRGYGGHTVFGLGLGGTISEVQTGARQSAKVNTFMATGYGSFMLNDWNLSANIGYASSDYTFQRRIFTVNTENKLRGNSIFGGAELSKMLRYNELDIMPYASLHFITVDVGRFHDASVDGLDDITIDSGNSTAFLQTFGVRLGRSLTGRRGAVWTPNLNLGWIHDYGKGTLRSKTTFGGSAPFTVIGAERTRDRMLLGVGTNVALRRLTLFGAYDAELSGDFNAHTLQAGVNMAF